MRKFKFLALAFAAFSFAACSDDVIEGQSGNGGIAGDGTPAYLTISFSANSGNSSRSTADDANNNGDEHSTDKPATGEDSGHHSDGLDAERQIKNILVVVAPESATSGLEGFKKLYSVYDAATADEGTTAGADDFEQTTSGIYKNAEPIEIKTGKYKVLVVVNPVAAISDGTALAKDAYTLYDEIIKGAYDYNPTGTDEDNYENAANSIGMGVGYVGNGLTTNATGFMMANKAEASVTVNQINDEDNPAKVSVEVERVLSKITFRSIKPTETNKENVYKVNVTVGNKPAITMHAALAKATQSQATDDDANYDYKLLNKAKDLRGQEVYGEYDAQDKLLGVYKIVYQTPVGDPLTPQTVQLTVKDVVTTCTVVEKIDYITEEEFAALPTTPNVPDASDYCFVTNKTNPSINLQYNTNAPVETVDWYVKLEGYALVNLSKTVNYVRHTITGTTGIGADPFGTLDGTNYLWTPSWDNNHNIALVPDANGDMQFGDGETTDGWFYNTLAQVSEESEDLSISYSGTDVSFTDDGVSAKYFKPLNKLYSDNSSVEDDPHYDVEEGEDATPAVGELLSYCFENSTNIERQVHGLSTGISFVATIWKDANCSQEIEKLYLYQGHNFTTIDQIKKAYPTIEALQTLTESSTKTELEAADVELYDSNICYYYTTEIKHFDNGDPNSLGNMEFAIMRNNIYSLSVSKIEKIGDPFVDPTPGIVNESEEALLEVQVKMLPWIVRYNNIEFN